MDTCRDSVALWERCLLVRLCDKSSPPNDGDQRALQRTSRTPRQASITALESTPQLKTLPPLLDKTALQHEKEEWAKSAINVLNALELRDVADGKMPPKACLLLDYDVSVFPALADCDASLRIKLQEKVRDNAQLELQRQQMLRTARPEELETNEATRGSRRRVC